MFIAHIDKDPEVFKEILDNFDKVTFSEKIDGTSIIMGLDDKGPYIKRKHNFKYRIDSLDQQNHSHKTILRMFEFQAELYHSFIMSNTQFEAVFEYVNLARPNIINYISRQNFKDHTLVHLSGTLPKDDDLSQFNRRILAICIKNMKYRLYDGIKISSYDYDGKIELLTQITKKLDIIGTEGFVLIYNDNFYKIVDNVNFSKLNRKMQFNRDVLRPIISGKAKYSDYDKAVILNLIEIKMNVDKLFYNCDDYIKSCKYSQEKEYLFIAKGDFDGWKML